MLRLFLILALLLPASALAEIAAEFSVDSAGSSFGSFGIQATTWGRGQVFEAEASGILAAVSVRVGRSTVHEVDLRVSVYAEAGGVPTGEALAQGTIRAEFIPVQGAGSPQAADMTGAELMLEAGTKYVIAVEPVTLDPGTTTYYWNGHSGDDATYEGGGSCILSSSGWNSNTFLDWGFRVEVGESTPVEAASWGWIKREYAPAP